MKLILTSRILITISVLGLFLSMPRFTYADTLEAHPHNHFKDPKIIITMLDLFLGLNLTEDQKSSLDELIDENRTTIKTIRTDIKELRLEMDDTFFSNTVDTVKASEQIDTMVKLRSQLTTAYLNAKLEGVQLFTPEQRALILKKKNEWRDRFHFMRNPLKLFMK